MNNDVDKIKLRMNDIMNEIANLKKYSSELMNNCSGEKIENYLNKLNNNITKAQIKIEDIYTETLK